MALTDDEKRTIKAYNIGYTMSIYEPKLLAEIIKSNPENEFVRAMQIARDHHEFHANIPRKDYSRDFKNGFYNGRTLAQYSPEVIERMMTGNGVSKDFKNGLEAAKMEYAIKSIKEKSALERADQNPDAAGPKWLQEKTANKNDNQPSKQKAKSKGRDYDDN